MKILITGGAGFIGSNIAEKAVNDYEVVILDNLSTGKMENIKQLTKDIELINGDICSLDTIKKAMKGVDFVLHQAGVASVEMSIKNPTLVNNTNVIGTLNVLEAARQEKVKKVVCASSAAVYGDEKKLPVTEDMHLKPLSPYGITKLLIEQYCRVFTELFGLKTTCLRYFNVYGSKQDPKSEYSGVISIFTDKMKNKQQPLILGDGKNTRDFVYVKDVVEANLLAMHSDKTGNYNIASSHRTSLNELVDTINEVLNTNLKPIYTKERKGDIKHSFADISKAVKELGYEPEYDLEKGLKEMLNA